MQRKETIKAFAPRTLLVLLPFLLTLGSLAQQTPTTKVVPFRPADYAAGKFQITRKDFPHGDVTIRVIEVKNLGYQTEPHTCRAWLQVERGNQLLKQLYYDDIDAVGFSYGIFVPKHQPSAEYFTAVKEGDYDGRLLLVSKDGTLADLPGGFYFLSEDKKYVIGEYAQDESTLMVVDLAQSSVIIDGRTMTNVPEIFQWYEDDAGYFFTETDVSKSWPAPEKKGHAYRLDLEKRKITRINMPTAALAGAHKVPYDFDPRKLKDCTAEPQ